MATFLIQRLQADLSSRLEPSHPYFAVMSHLCQALSGIEQQSPNALDDLWWEVVDMVKSHLGAEAANGSSDQAQDQERSIDEAEAWVTDNLSTSAPSSIEAAALIVWSLGPQEAQARLEAIRASTDSGGRRIQIRAGDQACCERARA